MSVHVRVLVFRVSIYQYVALTRCILKQNLFVACKDDPRTIFFFAIEPKETVLKLSPVVRRFLVMNGLSKMSIIWCHGCKLYPRLRRFLSRSLVRSLPHKFYRVRPLVLIIDVCRFVAPQQTYIRPPVGDTSTDILNNVKIGFFGS